MSFTDDRNNEESLTSAPTVAVAATVPGTPQRLNVTVHDTGALEVSWEAPASDGGSTITGYNVQWKESADSWTTSADVSEETANGTPHTITGLTDGVEYTVRVMAVNNVGEGPPSAEASGTPQQAAIWSATLTVGAAETFAGYTIFLPDSTVLGALSSDTVTLDDASYTVRALGLLEGNVILTVSPKLTAGFVLVVGTAEFASADASTQEAHSLIQFRWNDPGLDLSEGKEVAVSLGSPDDNTPATGAPTVSGMVQVDETLTADTSAISDSDGLTTVSYSYQWIWSDGNTDTDIEYATGPTYELSDADEGKTIKVQVSFTDDADNNETLTSAATAAVAAKPNTAATGLPTISGTAQVEQTLTADVSGIADEDGLTNASYRYQWVRSNGGTNVDISGHTGSTYTLASADEGKTIKVRVSFTDDADYQETLTSAATAAVAAKPNTAATGLPTISGTAQVDETLTAETSGIADEDGLDNVSYSYQWMAGGSDIDGATGSSHMLTSSEKGQTIKVRVTFTDDADNQETLTSAATAAVAAKPNIAATGLPTISGTAQVDETLTAETSGIADEDGLDNVSYSYQWMAGGADIDGATGSSFTLTPNEQGQTIQVRVSFTDDADNRESLTSAETAAVAPTPSPLTVSLENAATSHNGSDVFTFEIRFSEQFGLSYKTLKFHAFTVTGGSVKKAQRMDRDSDTPNIRWLITVQPNANGDVTITLPVTTDCTDDGAICTGDGRMLSNSLIFTVIDTN